MPIPFSFTLEVRVPSPSIAAEDLLQRVRVLLAERDCKYKAAIGSRSDPDPEQLDLKIADKANNWATKRLQVQAGDRITTLTLSSRLHWVLCVHVVVWGIVIAALLRSPHLITGLLATVLGMTLGLIPWFLARRSSQRWLFKLCRDLDDASTAV